MEICLGYQEIVSKVNYDIDSRYKMKTISKGLLKGLLHEFWSIVF